ncbi:MAG TPA: cytochrome c oxidase subunit II [Acidimicrobiales bacterium]|nr:cytochrome c oxidase subunit II [Acidimicrobiales bacterium]
MVGSLLLAGCSSRGGVPDPVTKQGKDVLQLWRIVLGAGVVLGVFVIGLILWSVVRYRRPRDAAPGDLPKQTGANIPVEVFYTVVPLLIVAVLFGLTLRTQHRETRRSATPDLTVEVTGFQWGWRFHYPTQGVTVVGDANTPPTLVLPVNANVRLRLSTTDVIHSFFVPTFLVKQDMIPGVDDQLEVRPTHIGHFGGVCAEFCGLDHARMTFSVDVVSPSDFQAFAARQQPAPGGPGPDPNGPAGVGRQASVAR